MTNSQIWFLPLGVTAARGYNVLNEVVYKYHFIVFGRAVEVAHVPSSFKFAVMITDLNKWEIHEGPPPVIFKYSNIRSQ